MKKCSICKANRNVSEFYAHKGRKDGLQTKCKSCTKNLSTKWRLANKDKAREYVNKCSKNNRVARRNSARKRYENDPVKHRQRALAYAKKNPDKMAAAARKLRKNPVRRLHGRISNQLRYVLSNKKGGKRAFEILGYSRDDLFKHLERQFIDGMSWANMNEWHIDHIIPLKSFIINGVDDPELRMAWALTNLRPLWAKDNMSKSAKRTHLL